MERSAKNSGKPFDLIFQKVKTEEWCAQGDDFRTFLAEFVPSLSRTDLLVELVL